MGVGDVRGALGLVGSVGTQASRVQEHRGVREH